MLDTPYLAFSGWISHDKWRRRKSLPPPAARNHQRIHRSVSFCTDKDISFSWHLHTRSFRTISRRFCQMRQCRANKILSDGIFLDLNRLTNWNGSFSSSTERRFSTAFVNCKRNGQVSGQILASDRRLGIALHKVSDNQYVRDKLHLVREYPFAPIKSKQTTTIYIAEPIASSIGISRWKGHSSYWITFTPSYTKCMEHGLLLVDELAYGDTQQHNSLVIDAFSRVSVLKVVHESKSAI
jgi:hypothetical protein